MIRQRSKFADRGAAPSAGPRLSPAAARGHAAFRSSRSLDRRWLLATAVLAGLTPFVVAGDEGSDAPPPAAANAALTIEEPAPPQSPEQHSSTPESHSHVPAQDVRLDESAQAADLKGRDPMPQTLPPRGESRRPRRRDAESVSPLPDPRLSRSALLSNLLPLVVVLGLIGGTAYAVRRWLPRLRTADSGLIQVVGRAALSSRHQVALLRVGRRLILTVYAGDHAATLCEFTDEAEIAELLARKTNAAGPSSFETTLWSEAEQFASAGEEQAAAGDRPRSSRQNPRALSELLNRLKSLQSA